MSSFVVAVCSPSERCTLCCGFLGTSLHSIIERYAQDFDGLGEEITRIRADELLHLVRHAFLPLNQRRQFHVHIEDAAHLTTFRAGFAACAHPLRNALGTEEMTTGGEDGLRGYNLLVAQTAPRLKRHTTCQESVPVTISEMEGKDNTLSEEFNSQTGWNSRKRSSGSQSS